MKFYEKCTGQIKFSLLSIIEAIDKIELYTKEFDDSEMFIMIKKALTPQVMQFIVIAEMISNLMKTLKKKSNIPMVKN